MAATTHRSSRVSTKQDAVSRTDNPLWERAIRLHAANLKHCIETEDFQYVQASKAQNVREMLQASRTFEEPSPEVADKIKGIQIKDASEKQEVMANFTNQVRDLPNSTPNQDDWKNKINEQQQKVRKQSSRGIDEAADEVIAIIRALPADEQDSAANLAVAASNFVMNAVAVLFNEMNKVAGQIPDFQKGIWDGLKSAYDAVSIAVSSAINAIKGLSGQSLANDLDDPNIDPTATD